MKLVKPPKKTHVRITEEFGISEDQPICSICNQKIQLGEAMVISGAGALAYNREIQFYELSIPNYVSTTHTRCIEK